MKVANHNVTGPETAINLLEWLGSGEAGQNFAHVCSLTGFHFGFVQSARFK